MIQQWSLPFTFLTYSNMCKLIKQAFDSHAIEEYEHKENIYQHIIIL